jgi:hypothetical protein
MKSWNARIEESTNPLDLVGVARDFLDGWEAEDLALVPEAARPQRIKGVDDLAYWHQKLVDCFCTSSLTREENAKVRDMLRFFAFAAQRSVEIESMPPMSEHEAATRLFSERSVPKLFTSAMTGASEH